VHLLVSEQYIDSIMYDATIKVIEHCCYINTYKASKGFHKQHPVMRCTI